MKTCKKCEASLPLEDFGKDASTKDGLTRWCRKCRNANQIQWQRDYRERRDAEEYAEYNRRWHLKDKYGISPERFDEMLEAQGGTCATCLETPQTSRTFHVDHNHSCCPGAKSCGECIRGILCRNCNVTLGLVMDDPDRLERLASYVRNYENGIRRLQH